MSNAIAESYLEHSYDIRIRSSTSLATFMERQLDELKVKMERSSLALAAFERELTVINPEAKTNILESRLVQLNTEHTAVQADRCASKRPGNRFRADRLRQRWHRRKGTRCASWRSIPRKRANTLPMSPGITARTIRISPRQGAARSGGRGTEVTRAGIAQRVEVGYRESQRREEMAGAAAAQAKTEFDRVNARSYEYQAAKREAEADKTLYAELVRKIKEAGINAGFQNSAIRIADAARPALHRYLPIFL